MALVLADRVKETTTTTGTSDFALGGAVSGFQTFSAGVGNSNTTYYAVALGSDFEIGLGTLSSDGLTLARTTVLQSSNSDTKVSFAAGSKDIFVTYAADKAVYEDASGNVTVPAIFTATTKVVSPFFDAVGSAGGQLRNASGTSQLAWGAGGGSNLSLEVSTNLNGTNAQIDISPTGTGHVHIKPSGSGSLEISPTSAGTMNNIAIGGTTPRAGAFTTVTATTPIAAASGGTGLSSLGTGVATFLGTPSSSNLASAVTDETGSGSLVFATSPTLVTPILGTPTSATLTNATGLPLSTGVTGTLPIANGGTNSTATATAGGIGYGTGTAHAYTAAGTSGQVLTSAGASAPTWATPTSSQWTTTGSNIYYTTGNVGIGTSTIGTTLVLANSDSSTIGQLRYARSADTTFYWETGRDNQLTGDFLFSNASGGAKTERMRINGSGTVILQGGSTSATGVGITFPATQSASTDANTLDDYEEGTWTPTLKTTGTNFSSLTYSSQTGDYVKIGSYVYCQFFLQINSVSGGTGDIQLSGLPFASSGSGRPNSGGYVQLVNGWTINNPSNFDASGAASTDYNIQYRATANGVSTALAASAAAGSAYIRATILIKL